MTERHLLALIRRSIKAKLVVGTVSILLVAICVLTFITGRASAELLRTQSMLQLSQLLNQSRDLVSGFLEVRAANLDQWRTNPLVISVVSDPALGAVFVPSLYEQFELVKQKEPWIENIFLVKDGDIVYEHIEGLSLSNASAEASDSGAILTALETSGASIVNTTNPDSAEPKTVVAIKRELEEEGAAVAGAFIVVLLDLEVIQAKLLSHIKVGANGFLSIVANVASTDSAAIWSPRQDNESPEWADFQSALSHGRLDALLPLEYESIVLDRRALDSLPVSVVGVAALNDVHAPVRRLIYTSILFAVLASVLGLVVAVPFSERLTAPIRALTEKARAFAAGDLALLPEVASSPSAPGAQPSETYSTRRAAPAPESEDEIGQLATTFDQMARDISELIGELEIRNDMSRAAISTRDIDEIMTTVVEAVATSGHYDRVRLYLHDEPSNSLACRASHGMSPKEANQLKLPLGSGNDGVAQYVFRENVPYLVEDAASDPKCTPDMVALLGITTSAVVPLLAGERALGVMAADYSTSGRQFPEEKLPSLSAFANAAALAIDNSLLYGDLEEYSRTLERRVEQRTEELETRVAQLDTLNRITETVGSALDLETQFGVVAREMVAILDARDAGIALLDDAGSELEVIAFHAKDPAQSSTVGTVIPVSGNASTEKVMATRQSLVINSAQTSPLTAPLHDIFRTHRIQSLIIIPLISKGEVIGTIGVTTDQPDRVFGADEVNLAETVAASVAGAVERARLFDDVQTQRRVAESLRQVAAVLNASLDLDTILPEIMDQMRKVLAYDSGAVFFREGERLALKSGAGIGDEHLGYQIAIDSVAPEARVFNRRRPIIIDDVRNDPTWKMWSESDPVRAWMGVPLLAGDEAIGILATDSFSVGAFGQGHARVLQAFSDHATKAIQNARLYATAEESKQAAEAANREISILNERLKEENLRMSAELEVTRELQRMILPTSEELEAVAGVDISGYMEPAEEVGGDYYDVLQPNGRLVLSIGDVTGHGLESGVVMLMTQTAVRTLLTQGETDPVRFLDTLNRTLYDNVRRMGTDKNLTLSLLDYAAGEVRLSGQHEELIVVRNGGQVERFDTMDLGFPLGLADDIADFVGQVSIPLADGDGVVLYTDGVTEAEDTRGEQYGLERLCRTVGDNWSLSSQAIKDAVIADLHHHIGAQQVYDDVTLVVLKRDAKHA